MNTITRYNGNKIQIFLEYVFVITMILQCNSIYVFQIGHSKIFINILFQLSLLLIFFLSLNSVNNIKNNYKLVNSMCIFFMLGLFFFIFEFIYYPQFNKFYIIKLLLDPIMIITYFFSCNNISNYKKIFYMMEKIIILLAIISIPFWIMANLHIPTTTSILTSQWYSTNGVTPISSYFHIGFIVKSHSNLFGIDFLRNSGIFAEASMYAYVLSIALFIELFLKKNAHTLSTKVMFLLLVILSTASTTNIVFAFLAILFKEILNSKKNKSIELILVVVVPILFIFLKYIISNKANVETSSMNNSSYSIRMDDIRASTKAWSNHLLIGNGLGNNESIKQYMSPWRYSVGNTSISAGLTSVLACGGIILLLLYIMPIICSAFISPYLLGLSFFIIMPLMFVAVQNTYLCIFSICYIWAYILFNNNNVKLIR